MIGSPRNSSATLAITTRACEESDMKAITEIYRHHVLTSLATFEIDPPSQSEMLKRHSTIVGGGYGYLVAVDGEKVTGFAYLSSYRPRPAYRYTVENSVYVAPGYQRRGIGRMLMLRLLEDCRTKPFRQVIAVIGDSANVASIELHRGLGFQMIGIHHSVGYKFDRWLDSVLMQKDINGGDHSEPRQIPTNPA
jgi:L-amino acid N-acyltransferase YncA